MNNPEKTQHSSDALTRRSWLKRTARISRRLKILQRSFNGIYSVFMVTFIASYWLPLVPLATVLGIIVALFILVMLPFVFTWMWRNRSMTKTLATIDSENSIANICASACIGNYLLPRSNRLQVAAIMDHSLPLLTAPLLLDMSVEDRRDLYEYMVSAKPTTCRAILSLCEQAQDILAPPFVRRLIRRYRNGRDADVLAQAIHCLEILNPEGAKNQSHLLLRPSRKPTDAALLRPVADHASAPAELLRASVGIVDAQRQERVDPPL